MMCHKLQSVIVTMLEFKSSLFAEYAASYQYVVKQIFLYIWVQHNLTYKYVSSKQDEKRVEKVLKKVSFFLW